MVRPETPGHRSLLSAPRRRLAYTLALLSAAFALDAILSGCGSEASGAAVDVIGANPERSLQGRRLAVSLGNSQIRDIWVLANGRLVQVSKRVRVATGGSGCYSSAYGSGSGPCYQYAEPFALSPDGKQLAFLLSFPVEGATDLSDALIVSRVDGSHAHQVKLGICALCTVSTPSWARDSRSFVIGVEDFVGEAGATISKIFRIAAGSGRATMLSPPGTGTFSEDEPAVSPDGDRIAFLRDVRRGPADITLGAPRSSVYLMPVSGRRPVRLPFPSRGYVDLWWCGNSTMLCVDSPTRRLGASANVYRLDLRHSRMTNLRHWPEAGYGGLSTDGRFALTSRKAGDGWQLLVGPVDRAGIARLAPLLRVAKAKRDPFYESGVSEPQVAR